MKKKKSVVIEIMEQKLSPYGFKYSEYEILRWIFSREVNGQAQYVAIMKSNLGDSYYLEMGVSRYDLSSHRIPDITGNPKAVQDMDYHNEEEQIQVLKELGDIVIYYGLEKLNSMKTVQLKESYVITAEMYNKLFDEKEALTQNFLERHQLKELLDDKILSALEQEEEQLQGKEYEEVQDKLIELAAVYGNLIVASMGGRWTSSDDNTFLRQVPIRYRVFPLKDIVRTWEYKMESIADWYRDMLEAFYQRIDSYQEAQEFYQEVQELGFTLPKSNNRLMDMKKINSQRFWAMQAIKGRKGFFKTEAVREILCPQLSPEKGYRYIGYKTMWKFEFGDKFISISDIDDEAVKLEFEIWGRWRTDGSRFVDKNKVKVDSRGYCLYKNEEEFRNVIFEIAETIQKRGKEAFDRINMNHVSDSTAMRMQRELYNRNYEWTEKGKELLGIKEWEGLHNIKQVCERLAYINENLSFKEAEQELLALSAVYGELFRQVSHGDWRYNRRSETCIIEGEGIGTFPLSDVVLAAWRTENYQMLVNRYLYAERTFGKG